MSSAGRPRIPAVKTQRQLDMAACRALADKACDSCAAQRKLKPCLADFTPETPPRPLLALETIVVNEPLTSKSRCFSSYAEILRFMAGPKTRWSLKKISGSAKRLSPPPSGLAWRSLTPNRNGYATPASALPAGQGD